MAADKKSKDDPQSDLVRISEAAEGIPGVSIPHVSVPKDEKTEQDRKAPSK